MSQSTGIMFLACLCPLVTGFGWWVPHLWSGSVLSALVFIPSMFLCAFIPGHMAMTVHPNKAPLLLTAFFSSFAILFLQVFLTVRLAKGEETYTLGKALLFNHALAYVAGGVYVMLEAREKKKT